MGNGSGLFWGGVNHRQIDRDVHIVLFINDLHDYLCDREPHGLRRGLTSFARMGLVWTWLREGLRSGMVGEPDGAEPLEGQDRVNLPDRLRTIGDQVC